MKEKEEKDICGVNNYSFANYPFDGAESPILVML